MLKLSTWPCGICSFTFQRVSNELVPRICLGRWLLPSCYVGVNRYRNLQEKAFVFARLDWLRWWLCATKDMRQAARNKAACEAAMLRRHLQAMARATNNKEL